MKKYILILSCLFLSSNLFSQTVIKTLNNRKNSKKVIVKNNKKNSKKVIIKDNHHHHNNGLVISNRDRLVVNKPIRPKKFRKKIKRNRRGFIWVSGSWKWSPIFRRHLWHVGHWIKTRRHHHWHDGYWEETMHGYYWIEGFWCNQI
jgi:hypothetical protein|tara:strand:+ start:273 stop:710 length:438 start_codon:yes stop_codon:yes gene_type:complete